MFKLQHYLQTLQKLKVGITIVHVAITTKYTEVVTLTYDN